MERIINAGGFVEFGRVNGASFFFNITLLSFIFYFARH
jgi:hypothetical protein